MEETYQGQAGEGREIAREAMPGEVWGWRVRCEGKEGESREIMKLFRQFLHPY